MGYQNDGQGKTWDRNGQGRDWEMGGKNAGSEKFDKDTVPGNNDSTGSAGSD